MARDYATAMHGAKEGRDIIPRAKPSQVYGQPDWYPSYTVAPTYTEKSALNSLRSLHKMLSPEVEKPSAYLGKEELEVEEVRYLSSEEEGESAGSDEESDEGSEDEEEFGGEKRRYSSTPYMAGTYIGEEVYRPSLAESWALTGRP